MLYYFAIAILEAISFLITTFIITFMINFIFVKDFRTLLKQIKKVVIFNPEKVNKTTTIKKLIYNYLF